MRAMVTIAHPWPGSFNFAVLGRVVEALDAGGLEADVLDLYRDDFNPVLSEAELAGYARGKVLDPKVLAYQERIRRAEHLIYIFPIWWEGMPALLKGFFDKVFTPGFAFTEDDFSPLLTHIKSGTAITTLGAPEAQYTDIEKSFLQGTLGVCGVQRTQWLRFVNIPNSTHAQRTAWLDEVAAYVRGLGRV